MSKGLEKIEKTQMDPPHLLGTGEYRRKWRKMVKIFQKSLKAALELSHLANIIHLPVSLLTYCWILFPKYQVEVHVFFYKKLSERLGLKVS